MGNKSVKYVEVERDNTQKIKWWKEFNETDFIKMVEKFESVDRFKKKMISFYKKYCKYTKPKDVKSWESLMVEVWNIMEDIKSNDTDIKDMGKNPFNFGMVEDREIKIDWETIEYIKLEIYNKNENNVIKIHGLFEQIEMLF